MSMRHCVRNKEERVKKKRERERERKGKYARKSGKGGFKKISQQNKSGIRIRKKEGSNVVMQRPTCKLVFLCICTDRRSLLFGLMLMLMLVMLAAAAAVGTRPPRLYRQTASL